MHATTRVPPARLRKYRDRAFDSAALIAAVAVARFPDASLLCAFRPRHDDLLGDLLHEFAFNARKAIELASLSDRDLRSLVGKDQIFGLTSDTVAGRGSFIRAAARYSLWFVLGRLIHSEDLSIVRAHVSVDDENEQLTHELPWMFTIQSDLDARDDRRHHIWVDELLEQYLSADKRIVDVLGSIE